MAVTWDCSTVEDWKTLHEDEYQWALTGAFLSSNWGYGWFDILGVGSITKDNAGEVWARLATLQGLGVIGMTGMTIDDKVLVTRADVERRIGLKSNYSTLTRAKWVTTKLKVVMDSIAN